MRDGIQPARLTRSRRAHLLAGALLLSGVLVAGCTGSSGSPGPGERGPRGHLRVRRGNRPGRDRAGRPAHRRGFQLPGDKQRPDPLL